MIPCTVWLRSSSPRFSSSSPAHSLDGAPFWSSDYKKLPTRAGHDGLAKRPRPVHRPERQLVEATAEERAAFQKVGALMFGAIRTLSASKSLTLYSSTRFSSRCGLHLRRDDGYGTHTARLPHRRGAASCLCFPLS